MNKCLILKVHTSRDQSFFAHVISCHYICYGFSYYIMHEPSLKKEIIIILSNL